MLPSEVPGDTGTQSNTSSYLYWVVRSLPKEILSDLRILAYLGSPPPQMNECWFEKPSTGHVFLV